MALSQIKVGEAGTLSPEYLQAFLARCPFPFTDPNDAHAFLQKNRERGQEHGVQWLEHGLKIRFQNEVIDLDKVHYWVYFPVKRTREKHRDQGVSVQFHYSFPVPNSQAYFDPGDGQVLPVPEGADPLELGPLVWVRAFVQRLEDNTEEGKAHNRRVFQLRKMLYEYNEMLSAPVPGLRASWDYDDDDDDDDWINEEPSCVPPNLIDIPDDD